MWQIRKHSTVLDDGLTVRLQAGDDSTVRLQAGDDSTVRLQAGDDLNRCGIRRRPVAIAPLIVRLLLEDDLKLLCAS